MFVAVTQLCRRATVVQLHYVVDHPKVVNDLFRRNYLSKILKDLQI